MKTTSSSVKARPEGFQPGLQGRRPYELPLPGGILEGVALRLSCVYPGSGSGDVKFLEEQQGFRSGPVLDKGQQSGQPVNRMMDCKNEST